MLNLMNLFFWFNHFWTSNTKNDQHIVVLQATLKIVGSLPRFKALEFPKLQPVKGLESESDFRLPQSFEITRIEKWNDYWGETEVALVPGVASEAFGERKSRSIVISSIFDKHRRYRDIYRSTYNQNVGYRGHKIIDFGKKSSLHRHLSEHIDSKSKETKTPTVKETDNTTQHKRRNKRTTQASKHTSKHANQRIGKQTNNRSSKRANNQGNN